MIYRFWTNYISHYVPGYISCWCILKVYLARWSVYCIFLNYWSSDHRPVGRGQSLRVRDLKYQVNHFHYIMMQPSALIFSNSSEFSPSEFAISGGGKPYFCISNHKVAMLIARGFSRQNAYKYHIKFTPNFKKLPSMGVFLSHAWLSASTFSFSYSDLIFCMV